MRRFDLWLALRLLAGQKLRAATLFCGMLASSFLVDAFGQLGGWLLREVCGEGERARFDGTFGVLAVLAAVLVLLVCFCAYVLLRNLYTVTLVQRQKSLIRLRALGADRRTLGCVTLVELIVLFPAAALPGVFLARLTVRCAGVSDMPFRIDAAALGAVLAAAALCALRPLSGALRAADRNAGCVGQRKKRRAGNAGQRKKRHAGRAGHLLRKRRSEKPRIGQTRRRKIRVRSTRQRMGSFYRYMARAYREADRGRYRRITAAFAVAILLFVPADHVIGTNLALHRAGLDMKYGVQYDAGPRDEAELQAALAACKRLAAQNAPDASVTYAALPVTAEVEPGILSGELRALLRESGWEEEPAFAAAGTLLFLDEGSYAAYVRACGGGADCPAVLIDRYTNRAAWKSDARAWPRETALLSDAGAAGLAGSLRFFSPDEERRPFRVAPGLVTDKLPDGVDFDGNLTVILPLGMLPALQFSQTQIGFLRVCGKYEDAGASSFQELVSCLGADALGALRNSREIFAEWYLYSIV